MSDVLCGQGGIMPDGPDLNCGWPSSEERDYVRGLRAARRRARRALWWGLAAVAAVLLCLVLHGCSTPRSDLIRSQRDEALALAERLQWDACEGPGERLYSDEECAALEARLVAVERGAEADWMGQRRALYRVYALARPYAEQLAQQLAAWAWGWLLSRLPAQAAGPPVEPLGVPVVARAGSVRA